MHTYASGCRSTTTSERKGDSVHGASHNAPQSVSTQHHEAHAPIPHVHATHSLGRGTAGSRSREGEGRSGAAGPPVPHVLGRHAMSTRTPNLCNDWYAPALQIYAPASEYGEGRSGRRTDTASGHPRLSQCTLRETGTHRSLADSVRRRSPCQGATPQAAGVASVDHLPDRRRDIPGHCPKLAQVDPQRPWSAESCGCQLSSAFIALARLQAPAAKAQTAAQGRGGEGRGPDLDEALASGVLGEGAPSSTSIERLQRSREALRKEP